MSWFPKLCFHTQLAPLRRGDAGARRRRGRRGRGDVQEELDSTRFRIKPWTHKAMSWFHAYIRVTSYSKFAFTNSQLVPLRRVAGAEREARGADGTVAESQGGGRRGGAVQAEMQPTHNSKAPGYNPWKLYKVMSWSLKPLLSHATCAAKLRRRMRSARSER
jgi:hypothetical protein